MTSTASQESRSLLIKPASGDCNLHCTYCFYHNRPDDPYKQQPRRRMSPDVLDTLIRQGMALDRRHATFGWQGGEPTLAGLEFFQSVVELQKRYGTRGQAVSNGMQTNGLLLDPEWARFLRKYNFLLGVSLDGPAPYHDMYRTSPSGAATHERVMRSLRMLQQYHVEFNLLAVVNRTTAEHPVETYDYLLSQGFHYLQFIPCVEVDPQTGRPTDFSVEPAQFGDFLCALFDRWYNGGSPDASVRDFDAILSVYMGQEAPLCCYQKYCGSYLVVEYNGDVYPCDFMVRDDLYIGNLTETPLEDLFAGEAVRRFARTKAAPRAECRDCPWLPYCHQGCPRLVGIAEAGRHYLCAGYRQFYEHSRAGFIELSNRLKGRPGPGDEDVKVSRSVGRNDPCPCGSGKKYKQCCGRKGAI